MSGELSAEHLSWEQFELLASNSAGKDIIAHLESCNACREKAKAYEAAAMKLNRLKPVVPAGSPGCPRAEEWPLVASGVASPEKAKEYLLHAAQCDHCSPLIRTTRAFDDELTPEEELAISRLTVQESERRHMAAMLSAKSQVGYRPPKAAPRRWMVFKHWPALAYGLATATLVTFVGTIVFLSLHTESLDKLLAEAYSQQRTLEPRFAGAKYGPVRILRGDGQSSLNKSQALLDAESLIHRHLLEEPNSPLWLDAKGRVDLLEANYDAALQSFQKALDLDPDSPRWLTDAASAYFERGQLASRPADYGQAIELLGHALARSPDDTVALYNRALVNEKMFLYHEALGDWNHYLRIDPSGDWAEEAKRHRDSVQRKLSQEQQRVTTPLLDPVVLMRERMAQGRGFLNLVDLRAEDYLDHAIRVWLPEAFHSKSRAQSSALRSLRILAEVLSSQHGDQWLTDFVSIRQSKEQVAAVQMLVDATRANAGGDYHSAQTLSLQARQLFARSHNIAGALRAQFETIYAMQRSNQQNESCVAEADSVIYRLRGRHYPWLETQLYLERFMCAGQLAHFNEARADLDKAFALSEKSGYGALYLRTVGMAASLHRGDGDAILFDHQGLVRYWEGNYPPARAFQFYSDIAFAAEDGGQWSLALAAAREAVSAISSADQPLTEGLARYQLARYALKAGDRVLADSESTQARTLLSRLPQNEVTRSYQVNQEVRLARLETEGGKVDQAWMHLAHARFLLPQAKNYFTTLRFYNALSELQLRQSNQKEAEKALLAAIALSELGLASLRDESEKADWARETGEAYRKLVWLHWQARDVEGAWKIWEWYLGTPVRGMAISGAQPATHTVRMNSLPSNFEAASALPSTEEVSRASSALADETVVSYLQFSEGLAIWIFDDRGLSARWVAVTPSEVKRLARRFREECAHPGSDLATLRKDAQTLYDLLIAPIFEHLSPQRTLVIEPDGVLAEVPITALVDHAGHYLSETFDIIYSPGLLYAQHLRHAQSFSRHWRALVVGPPLLSGGVSTNLEPLQDAAQEAADIASWFDGGVLLTGSQATVEKVEYALGQADIFHFAGHALEVGGKPALLLAGVRPSLESAVLNAERIQAEDLPHLQLAVLSACSTGTNERSSVSGTETLVRSFLHHGVPDVVATRWNVDSAATAAFMTSFYGSLLKSQRLSSSLNIARAELRGRPATTHPFYWAAFDAFGR